MSSREPLVFLAHRIPYPPNKGDKIRSCNVLRALAEIYDVYLGAFVDDPHDWVHEGVLRELCAGVHLEPLHPLRGRLRGLTALLHGEAATLPFYRSGGMRCWVRDTVRRTGAQRLVAFSTPMAQYDDLFATHARRILDMVDVDSDKWRQYAENHRGLARWIYRREARCLLAAERAAAERFHATTLVSDAEVELFRELCPEVANSVTSVANGVDTDYFRPDAAIADPYAADCVPLVFTGAMDYWPNVDAVRWFADEVLPRIREHEPRAIFHIVGARPADAVRELERNAGVHVVGPVRDMRPWLQHARLAVAPLRVARGIQNKVLEALAMECPMLATTAALDGLELGEDYPLRADTPAEIADSACRVLAGRGEAVPTRHLRELVCERYAWESRLRPLLDLIAGPASATPVTDAVPRIRRCAT